MEKIVFMKSVNFEFLRSANQQLANLGGLAEAVLYIDPGSALTRLRGFAEELTKSIYKEERLPRMPQASFYDLVRDPVFEACVNKSLIHQINFLRVSGNDTAHGAEGNQRTALTALATAHQLACYLAISCYGFAKSDLPAFKDIPDPRGELKALKKSVQKYQQELEQQEKETERLIEQLDREREKLGQIEAPAKPDQQKRQQQSDQVAQSLAWDEARTRRLLIDTQLSQAGWDVNKPEFVGIEVELDFPDNPSGKGYADYVLWGDDGQPLAVVEAKRSSASLQAGREQARLYADAFERMGKQRPVIFYTNGYETFIWDDAQYNTYRRVYGFYSKESLDYLVFQRQYRQPDLERNNPNLSIANRPYQIEAIKTVAQHFQQQRRKALIIQATGTGKTRVAIALSDLLLNTNWAKRVLFLCDRKELRKQADDAFKEHLPGSPRCVIGETNKIDQDARVYIATYPGMMNRFAQLDVGFFDLIIADESHRSIYNRYRDLFDYFDALQLGLTATPVKFISRNTFDMFGCESTDPTFEFGLDAAINNQPPYLVPFKVKDLTTEFLREGIHYNDLNDAQKRQLEDDLGIEEAQQTRVAGKDLGRKLFSRETDRQILENLMENGIKDETGSLVGKTIVFAQRQDHAEALEKLFCELYPQFGSKVCKVIHNKVPKVDSLIAEFKKADNDFRIAISVDMMDTGIDVPEVVNLVFAKTVKSWVKFWQMIGRGTRLRPNLFGPGQDKAEFLIFDHYSNFAYFDEEYKEPADAGNKGMLQTLFEARLNLAKTALQKGHRHGFDVALELLRADIADLPEDSIAVKRELRNVHQLLQTQQLSEFNASTQHLLGDTIAPLMANRVLHDKFAISFDRTMAELEQAWIAGSSSFESLRDRVLEDLSKLAITIAAVRQKDAVLDKVQTGAFWHPFTQVEGIGQAEGIQTLEWLRTELRGIMKYRQTTPTGSGYTPTTRAGDSELTGGVREVKLGDAGEAMMYRQKLKKILDEMIDASPVLQAIRDGKRVSEQELQTLNSSILTEHPGVSLEALNEFYGRTAKDLQLTVRQLVGLDAQAVEAHFTTFLHNHPALTARQVRFMNLLKSYIAERGTIELSTLYEKPFTSVHGDGIEGVFKPEDVGDLVTVLKPYVADDMKVQ